MIEAIPAKIKANAVSVIKDIPVKMGSAIKRKDKIIPKTLTNAKFPQLNIPASFKSNEKPSKLNDRNITVNPITNGKTEPDMAG